MVMYPENPAQNDLTYELRYEMMHPYTHIHIIYMYACMHACMYALMHACMHDYGQSFLGIISLYYHPSSIFIRYYASPRTTVKSPSLPLFVRRNDLTYHGRHGVISCVTGSYAAAKAWPGFRRTVCTRLSHFVWQNCLLSLRRRPRSGTERQRRYLSWSVSLP